MQTRNRFRTEQIHVRLTTEEKELIAQAAQREGRTPGNFIRYHAIEAAVSAMLGNTSDALRPHEAKAV